MTRTSTLYGGKSTRNPLGGVPKRLRSDVTAFFLTPRYAGLGGVVAFALFCGAATAESPPIVTDDPYPCQRPEWGDPFRPPAAWFAVDPATSWDPASPAGPFTALVRTNIREAGYQPHWNWNAMLPRSAVPGQWWSIEQVIGYVMWCESRYDAGAIGDQGLSHGLMQIHTGYNPDVGIEEARDPSWAIAWSVPRLLNTPEWWSCFRRLRDGE